MTRIKRILVILQYFLRIIHCFRLLSKIVEATVHSSEKSSEHSLMGFNNNEPRKMKSKQKRKLFLVNKQIQIGLAMRFIAYWAAIWLLVFIFPIFTQLFFESVTFSQIARQLIFEYWFPMTVSLLVIPAVIWDSIRFSHRFTGPILRIERGLNELRDGVRMEPIRLRKGDYCEELGQSVNELAMRIQQDPKKSNSDVVACAEELVSNI